MDRLRKVLMPIMVFILLLLLALLFGLWFLNKRCLESTVVYERVSNLSNVLGISTLNILPDRTTVDGGDMAQFVVNANTDENLLENLINGTVTFKLTGDGRIVNPIEGPGDCLLVSETEAVCSNLGLEPNQENTYKINVQTNEDCGIDGFITLDTIIDPILGDNSDSKSINLNCEPADVPVDDGDGTTNPPPSGSDTNTNTTTTILSEEGDDINLNETEANLVKGLLDRHNKELLTCMTNNTIAVGGVGVLIYLLFWLFVFSYFMKDRETIVVSDSRRESMQR